MTLKTAVAMDPWFLKYPQSFHKLKVMKVAKAEIHKRYQQQNHMTMHSHRPQNTG